jgi:disulfide bond formation protein DsbB
MAGPSWHHRRRLIYSTYVLSAIMILFGAITYRTDSQVSTQLIVGGVSLISIILTAYTAFATLDDKWHFKHEDDEGVGG